MSAKSIVSSLVLCALAPLALASGGYGGGGGFGSGGFGDERLPRIVDPVYERGKAVMKGKVRDYGKIKYCVTSPDAESGSKLKGRTARAYRTAAADVFALSLYNCEVPEERIADVLAPEDLNAVVHYLNQRYKLRLQYI